jgi:hypothetical protein
VERLTAVEAIDSDIGGERLRAYLSSPEAHQIVGQLFLSTTHGGDDLGALLIREQFAQQLAQWLEQPVDPLRPHADRLFDAFVAAAHASLEFAIEREILAAHEASSAYRHRTLTDHLENIRHNLDLLKSETLPSIEELLEFEAQYRKQLVAREAHIVPPNLDSHEKRAIDDLYVAPQLMAVGDDDGRASLSHDQFLERFARAVVLGDPGGGKSTLTLKICFDLHTHCEQKAADRRHLTPILVVLRDYGAAKRKHDCSLLEFITTTAKSKYQLPDVPDGAFDYLMRNGRAVVIFDGLDELLDTSHRREISADVESFASFYTSCPLLVTSRRVGYEQAPLPARVFDSWQLAEFDEPRVREYAKKWFALETELEPHEREEKSNNFLAESMVVPDLRSNPLMLGLMCNIYRGQGYIPSNRPDVYEACAVMLFDRWDKSRDIRVELPFESRLRPAMQYLGHWIYSDQEFQAGVTRERLIHRATEYLFPKRFEDEDEAREAAGAFIDFCKGRAWVFTDTGSTATGSPLFQFTHRTFLEFFTADYLARTNNDPERLFGVLRPHVAQREWDVVSQLAIQLQTKYVEDAGDKMLGLLLDAAAASQDPDSSRSFLSFAARALEFLVPSPETTRRVTSEVVAAVIDAAGDPAPFEGPAVGAGSAVGSLDTTYSEVLLAALATSNLETRPTVQRALERLAIDLIQGHDEDRAVLGVEIGLHMAVRADGRIATAKGGRDWEAFSSAVVAACQERLRELAVSSFRVGVDAVLHNLWDVRAFVAEHGLDNAFDICPYRLYQNVHTIPIAILALLGVFPPTGSPWNESRAPVFEQALGQLGGILASTEPPWVHLTARVDYPPYSWALTADHAQLEAQWSQDHIFGLLAVLGTAIELGQLAPSAYSQPTENMFASLSQDTPLGHALLAVVSARLPVEGSVDVEQALQIVADESRRRLLRGWINGAVRLVGACQVV